MKFKQEIIVVKSCSSMMKSCFLFCRLLLTVCLSYLYSVIGFYFCISGLSLCQIVVVKLIKKTELLLQLNACVMQLVSHCYLYPVGVGGLS